MKHNTIYNNPWQRTIVTYPFVFWDNAFSAEDLQKLIDYAEADGKLERAVILGTDPSKVTEIERIRRCDIKFIGRNEDTDWFFERMNKLITSLNDQFYGFDLNGYEAFQYTSYNAEEKGTYHWHMDTCLGTEGLPTNMIEPRKLSITLLLNDDFEGGEFMMNDCRVTRSEVSTLVRLPPPLRGRVGERGGSELPCPQFHAASNNCRVESWNIACP